MKINKLLLSTLLASVALPLNSAARTVLQNKGSDTLVNVAQAWAEKYQTIKPDVAVAVSGGGSGTGIAAVINGTVDIANSSRQMKDKEIEKAKAAGINPVEHVVGYDALAVYVHPNNPANSLSFAQLGEIYGRGGKAEKWTDLGITVPECKDQKIVMVSRQNNSGTYEYFRKTAIGDEYKNKFKMGTLDLHGSKDVVDLVEKTPCAIGYSGLAYATDHVKKVCISKKEGEACVMPSETTAADSSYPIARPLFMYTKGQPEGEIKAYLDWILSNEGQCLIKAKGYAPAKNIDCPSL